MSKNFLSRTQASRQAPVHRRYDANQCVTSFFGIQYMEALCFYLKNVS